jgi:hypothetical protein
MHNEKLRMSKSGGACSTHGRVGKRIRNFGRKPEGKSPLGRPRRRWEFGIIMDFKEIG